MALPFAQEATLPRNRHIAFKTMLSVERRFTDKAFADLYHKAIMKNLTLGFTRKLTQEEERSTDLYFLPHFAVITDSKPNKPRIVFNGSSLCQGTSLNKRLCQGPNLILEMFDVFFLLRLRRVAVYGDINSFFHKVQVAEKDWKNCVFSIDHQVLSRSPTLTVLSCILSVWSPLLSSPLTACDGPHTMPKMLIPKPGNASTIISTWTITSIHSIQSRRRKKSVWN